MLRRLFYGPSDRFVRVTSARSRRAINFWLFTLWAIPGFIIWFVLRDVLWFVGFMSLYANLVTHWGGFSAETPTEAEE